MEANPYTDHQQINWKEVHDDHISLHHTLKHLQRESEASTMAAEAKVSEANSETLTGFSNILNKIGKEYLMRVKVWDLRKE